MKCYSFYFYGNDYSGVGFWKSWMDETEWKWVEMSDRMFHLVSFKSNERLGEKKKSASTFKNSLGLKYWAD